MQNAFKLAAVAALCATAVAAHAEATFDANLELDTTYTNEVDAPASNARDSDLGMGGRVEVNVAGKATNGDAFVAGRASLLVKKDGDTGVDDMWVQFGNAGMDVKLGRFEATDLFPVGKDTVLEYAGYEPYRAHKLRGRFGSDSAHGALGINAGPARIEVGMVYSKDDGEARGVRPAVVLHHRSCHAARRYRVGQNRRHRRQQHRRRPVHGLRPVQRRQHQRQLCQDGRRQGIRRERHFWPSRHRHGVRQRCHLGRQSDHRVRRLQPAIVRRQRCFRSRQQ